MAKPTKKKWVSYFHCFVHGIDVKTNNAYNVSGRVVTAKEYNKIAAEHGFCPHQSGTTEAMTEAETDRALGLR